MYKLLIIVLILLISGGVYMKIKTKTIRDNTKPISVDTHLELPEVPEGAAPANIKDREPYHALESLHSLKESRLSAATAKKCYNADTQAVLNKAGNYTQQTNNYKHSAPDNCTTLRQELAGNFYVE